jgi:hypothetical protein
VYKINGLAGAEIRCGCPLKSEWRLANPGGEPDVCYLAGLARKRTVAKPPISAGEHYATRAGLDPRTFAGHSLRAGFLTSAAEHGASVFKMMEVSRHRSVDTLRGSVRRGRSVRGTRRGGVPVSALNMHRIDTDDAESGLTVR